MDQERASLSQRSLAESGRYESSAKPNLVRLLLVLLLERLGYYVILYDISPFATNHLGFTNGQATALSDVFFGTSFFFPILFGVLSDRKLGYYPIITGALAIYPLAAGVTCYVVNDVNDKRNNLTTSCTEDDNLKTGAYLASLAVIALCSAAVNATLIPFMLEQLGEEGKGRRKLIKALCPLAYAFINVGSTLAILAPLIENIVNDYKGTFRTYLFSPISHLLALMILLIWRKQYTNYSAFGRADYWPNVFSILATGFGCYREKRQPQHYDCTELPFKNKQEKEQDEKDTHRRRLGVLVPILAAVTLYFTVYSQMTSSFVQQAMRIGNYKNQTVVITLNSSINITQNLSININCSNSRNSTSPYKILPSAFNGFDSVVVLIALPTVWFIIKPLYEKLFKREFQTLTKIHWGMTVALLAVVSAMAVEVFRYKHSAAEYVVTCSLACKRNSSELTPYSKVVPIETLLPQYALVGFSEALANTGVMEFVLSRAPREFRCTAFSFYYAVSGIGIYFSTLLILIFRKNYLYFRTYDGPYDGPYDGALTINTDKTWPYYLSISIMMLMSVVVFARVRYKHKDITRKHRDLMKRIQ
eukprot:m.57333 g.57333  ORF g.57333 m.57333 type:complete len:589 (+) comp34723_c0_seq1:15-1781(+)